MSDHARHAEDAAAYLLGALSDLERQAFEGHLAGCAECRQEIEHMRPAANALPRAVTPLVPPESLKRSLMEVVEREASGREPVTRTGEPVRTRLRERLGALMPSFGGGRPALAWASAAFLLAIGIAGGIGLGQLGSGDDETETLNAKVDRSRVPRASASLVVPGGGGDGAILRVNGMPSLEARRVYQLWVQRGDEIVPGPTFVVSSNGSGAAAVPDSLKGADAVMVTRERRGGAPAPSEGPILRVKV